MDVLITIDYKAHHNLLCFKSFSYIDVSYKSRMIYRIIRCYAEFPHPFLYGFNNFCKFFWLQSTIGRICVIGSKIDEEKIAELVKKNFSLSPSGIIRELDLLRPIYKQTAAYGHFGRTDVDLPWEHTDKAAALREQAGL